MTKGKNNDRGAAFGREIRRRREAVAMTLEVLAARSGLTQNFIGTIEIGKRDPSLSTVLALAKGLGVMPGELFASRAGDSPAAAEAGRLFDKAPLELQTAVMAILRAAAKKPRKGAAAARGGAASEGVKGDGGGKRGGRARSGA